MDLPPRTLVPLPPHPQGLAWPTHDWPVGDLPGGVDLGPLLDRAFDEAGPLRTTLALVVVHRGRLVAERYGEGVDAATTLISWSMAKSILHAAVGILVAEGHLDPAVPAEVPEWRDPDDPRRAITLDHLLAMRDGLAFAEDYVDERTSDVIPMLFGEGRDDVARFAAGRPLAAKPGTRFNYSSGTSNIVSGIVARAVGGGRDGYERWLAERLFRPLGMRSASPRFDAVGTFVASSFLYATARDFARFGYLYLRDGVWEDGRILPPGWVDAGRRPRSRDPEEGRLYGAHWWVEGDDGETFLALGYEGQFTLVAPALDLVVVRLGKTPKERAPELVRFRSELLRAFSAAR